MALQRHYHHQATPPPSPRLHQRNEHAIYLLVFNPSRFSTYSSIRPTTSMASPLSKRKNKWQKRRPMTVSSTFRPISIVELPGPECNPSFGLLQLDEWLATYEHDILQYDSLAAFAHVKLDEARRLSSKCPHPMNRFRVAVPMRAHMIHSSPTDV
ncbi:unnamed protein product [Aphanomyces euteiches]